MKKILSIAALLVSLNSSALSVVSHTSSSSRHHDNGNIQLVNDTTFMYHFHLDSDVNNDTIIYARTAEECLAIAKDYSSRHDYTLMAAIVIILIILSAWFAMHYFLKF